MFYIRWHNDKLIFHANKAHTKKVYIFINIKRNYFYELVVEL